MTSDDVPPYEIHSDQGIPVALPSGAVHYVMTDGEEHYLKDRIQRYLTDNHFVNVSDIQDIDRMITLELLMHRWTMWLSRGRDYYNDDINIKQYSDMVENYSKEVRQLKKSLGLDKSTRDRVRGDDSVAAYWDNLKRRAQEFGYLRNEQAVQAITSMQRIKAMLQFFRNCLGGDTEILTRNGVVPIASVAGQAIELLDGHGGWTECNVLELGQQEIWEIELQRSGRKKVIEATAEHRWFAYKRVADGTNRELRTDQLRAGDRLVSIYGKRQNLEPSPWGIAQGVVFGDGSASRQSGSGCEVRLCGGKAELLKWFPLSPSRSADGDPIVTGLPADWKERPSLKMDSGFLLGWLAGYLATDGSVDSKGAAHLDSVQEADVRLARDVCVRLCIPTTGISSFVSNGFGTTTTIWRLAFPIGAFSPDLLLRPEHRGRYAERTQKVPAWKVAEVRQTGRTEAVYCPEVPTTRSFVLEGNILTGNCDEVERKENACELTDVLEVIDDELGKFDLLDEEFRASVQTYWVRSQ